MLKQNKKTLVITSIVILLPVLAGLLLWDRLPEQIVTHWNANGEPDGWSSKSFVVFFLPLLMLGIHWLCTVATCLDPKHKNVDKKPLQLVLWIAPILCLVCSTMIYATALGYSISVNILMPLIVGCVFLIVGNYLPKCKQNYTLGIKLPWTLADEETWNHTHRFAGKVWVAGGILTMATALFGNIWLQLAILLVIVLAPTTYAYLYYKKHHAES